MFNVDRWAYYTAQHNQMKVINVYWMDANWTSWDMLTAAQRRRIIKKSRKNNDQSIGIF